MNNLFFKNITGLTIEMIINPNKTFQYNHLFHFNSIDFNDFLKKNELYLERLKLEKDLMNSLAEWYKNIGLN